jgi:hypothetical protein
MRSARSYQAAVALIGALACAVAFPPHRGSAAATSSAVDPRVCGNGKEAKAKFLSFADARNHYVEMFDGRFDCGYGPGDFNRVVDAYRSAAAKAGPSPLPLVLYFHGGLVQGGHGFEFPLQTGVWQTYTAHAFPVFFVWHSGGGEIGAREVLPQTGHITTAHGLINRWDYIHGTAAERERNDTGHPRLQTPPETVDVNAVEQDLRLQNVLNGANMWHHMEREIDWSLEPGADRGGHLMVEQLAKLAGEQPNLRVVLVGHSMGAIYASRLIETYTAYVTGNPYVGDAARNLQFEAVFLAPAVNYVVFDRTLRTGKVKNFRMFAMYDLCERKDHVARRALRGGPLQGFRDFYPRSLLYYVSSVTGPYPDVPLTGMERFLRDPQFDDNVLIRSVKQRLDQRYPSWLVLSPTANNSAGGPGFESAANSHGDFDGDDKVLASLGEIFEHGFKAAPATQPPGPGPTPVPDCGKPEPAVQ